MPDTTHLPLPAPLLPQRDQEQVAWGRAIGAGLGLSAAQAAMGYPGLTLLLTTDTPAAIRLEQEIGFFLPQGDSPEILQFPGWETLPYDVFSPLPEIISERLSCLRQLKQIHHGILILPVSTLMQRMPPRTYLDAHSLDIKVNQILEIDPFRRQLEAAGYRAVSQVIDHGEYAVRGSLIDLYPMGSQQPIRLDLFDDEIDSIRLFDPETQRSLEKVDGLHLLPAREFPTTQDAIELFRKNYRNQFDTDPNRSLIYSDVSQGLLPGGIEYYLPLFFDETETLFEYLPEQVQIIQPARVMEAAEDFFDQITDRFEQRRHDIERPLLAPRGLYLDPDQLRHELKGYAGIKHQISGIDERPRGCKAFANLATKNLPALGFQARAASPAGALKDFLKQAGRTLFVAETAGRREALIETLKGLGIHPRLLPHWGDFLASDESIAITVAAIESGLWLADQQIAVIPEALLLGERVKQRQRKKPGIDADQVIRNMTELHIGEPVVHLDHGIGRYLGLQSLDVGDTETEFLALEYARGDKLYVPVSSLHLISRYAGASGDSAPLHRLGGDQWEKIKKRAAKKVRDVAAELLEIYARREAQEGYRFPEPGDDYQQFSADFEFEETVDQADTIDAVISDMTSPRPMDRVVCGDVGFGKTEVAMRAAFIAASSGRQVAVLVPTTLLAQQHAENFADRFADWPIRVEGLSRFRSPKEIKQILAGLSSGTVDILIGTHRILGPDVRFKRLGLAIIDEEHRFGVRHKERLKALRSEVDILTLTATPIPRTLNMSMSGMRDLSIIATPPAARHPIKTFVSRWSDVLLTEAMQRELSRGGQIYFLHNEVSTIEQMSDRIAGLMPTARVQFAHGQMRERELERVMRDFYHQRFNILVCTTIVESGIDIPTANTIIINRADKLGLAQLHQLRGRVGRSHHRAYAYLLTPPPRSMTPDAAKRLEAIESLEDLGAGFTLATHDLEIRGAGELLGDEQSGQIHELGFTLYSEMLERAVSALKAGKQPQLDRPLDHGTEIDLGLPALLPEDYLPDVHTRLIQYKRIASAKTSAELRELKVEMIDRFGLLPDPAKTLFEITELKLKAQPYGIRKIEAGPQGGRLIFEEDPAIDPARIIQLIQTQPDQFKFNGADRLGFYVDLAEISQRTDRVSQILGQVVGQP